MGFSEFAFAFFIFLLICLMIWFNKKLSSTAKNKDQAEAEKEKQLFKLFQNLDDMMNSIEEYIEESREKIASDRTKSEQMLEQIEELYQRMIEQQEKNDKSEKSPVEGNKKYTKQAILSKAESFQMQNKNQRVWELKKTGIEDSQIARQLGISRGEVALILGMDNQSNNGMNSH